MNLSLIPIDYNERDAFNVWQARFANEYNHSPQAREGYKLAAGIDQKRWDEVYQYENVPTWIKQNKKNIGYVSPSTLTFKNVNTGEIFRYRYVCDVYVNPQYRGKGILKWVLNTMAETGYNTIAIDKMKLEMHANYYSDLGYHYMYPWNEENLLLLSREKKSDDWAYIFD